jgi:hypothetical protein
MRNTFPRRPFALLAALLVAPAALGGGESHVTPTADLAPDIEQYRQHLITISNPFFEGRAPDTRGNRLAADYLEFHLRRLNLTPAFPTEGTDAGGGAVTVDRSSFRQPFEAPTSQRPGASYRVQTQELSYGRTSLTPGTDFNIVGYSANGEATGPLAFAGYSIESGKDGYSSYPPDAGDLKGKVAVVLRFEPMDEAGKSRWADVRWSEAAALEPKLTAAQRAGASAIILVNAPGADDDRLNKLEDLSLAGFRNAQGRSLMDLRRLADQAGGVVDLPKATVTLKAAVEKFPIMTDNVGAILPGKGALADQFIVIGAHYDHVGYGYVGAQPENRGLLHPGADDNASGTSGNLLVAEKLVKAYAELPGTANARSVLFLWFSAEESGLVGSRWYVNHPIVPIEKHALMLNMDMIGRLREGKLEVGGVGSAQGLEDWTKPYWDSSGLTIKPSRIGAPNSDHYSFHLKKVPNLFFFTGLHKEYHKPADVYATINIEGAAQIVDLVYRVALDAAQYAPGWTFGVPSADEQPDRAAAPADPNAGVGSVTGVGVRFGIMPGDYSGEDGVLIGDVTENLPAAKAGLKGGDRMIRWNDAPLTTVESWMPLLSKHKPGDVVTIVYVRDGKELTTKAELVARGRPRQ